MAQNAKFARFEDNPVRQYAYYLYAADPSKPTSEWLDQLNEFAGEKVAERTVYDWRQRDQWERRFAQEVLAASGASVFEQVRRLRVAALPAIAYLSSVANGELAGDRVRMDAAKFLVQQSAAVHQVAAQADDVQPKVALDGMSTDALLALADRAAAESG